MSEGQKSSGAVTVLSIVGLVFGLIGMMGSFIPCLGSLAFFVGLPAALISGLALFIARANNSSRTFALVALVISLIGVVVSGTQYFSIISAGRSAQQAMEPSPQMKFEERAMPMQAQQPAPAPAKPPVDTSGINIVEQKSSVPENSLAAKAQFVSRMQAILKSAPEGNWVPVAQELIVANPKDWAKIPILLERGVQNTIRVGAPVYYFIYIRTTKSYALKELATGKALQVTVKGEADTVDSINAQNIWNSKIGEPLDIELVFPVSYNDKRCVIYIPAAYKGDYKITLENARVDK